MRAAAVQKVQQRELQRVTALYCAALYLGCTAACCTVVPVVLLYIGCTAAFAAAASGDADSLRALRDSGVPLEEKPSKP